MGRIFKRKGPRYTFGAGFIKDNRTGHRIKVTQNEREPGRYSVTEFDAHPQPIASTDFTDLPGVLRIVGEWLMGKEARA